MVKISGKLRADVAQLWERFYPNYSEDFFADEIARQLEPSFEILEIGAGSGEGLQTRFPFKNSVARYTGIDLDPRITANPHLHDGIVAAAEILPFSDATFDLVFHTMVAEHLDDPLHAIGESLRVLKPGGKLLFFTVSRWYYPMLVAALTPHAFHSWYVGRFGSGRNVSEVFPTRYRCNDAHTIRTFAKKLGVQYNTRYVTAPPGYLRFHPLAFLLGVAYERTVARVFPPLRAHLLVEILKPT